jgi:hypothetical protein
MPGAGLPGAPDQCDPAEPAAMDWSAAAARTCLVDSH